MRFVPIHIAVRAALVLAAAMASMASLAGQDSFGYQATDQTPAAFLDVSSTGIAVLAGGDDATATLVLPFPFRFYGVVHNSACVSSNGLLSFGGCVAGDLSNVDLSSQPVPGDRPVIAPFWDDLTFAAPGAGAVYYQTLGPVGARQFVVQWDNAFGLNGPFGLQFQVVLLEGTNQVLFQYRSVNAGLDGVNRGTGATVGIRNAGGHLTGQFSQWSFNAATLSDHMAIQFSPPLTGSAVDVTGSFSVTLTDFSYNPAQKRSHGNVRITNESGTAIPRPLAIVISQLPPDLTLLNPSGTVSGLGPYVVAPGNPALPSKASIAIPLSFNNPNNTPVLFQVRVYSGNF